MFIISCHFNKYWTILLVGRYLAVSFVTYNSPAYDLYRAPDCRPPYPPEGRVSGVGKVEDAGLVEGPGTCTGGSEATVVSTIRT